MPTDVVRWPDRGGGSYRHEELSVELASESPGPLKIRKVTEARYHPIITKNFEVMGRANAPARGEDGWTRRMPSALVECKV